MQDLCGSMIILPRLKSLSTLKSQVQVQVQVLRSLEYKYKYQVLQLYTKATSGTAGPINNIAVITYQFISTPVQAESGFSQSEPSRCV